MHRELAALTARLTTLGYQDGIDDGVEATVQNGFDEGYAVGAAAGWEAGTLYGGAAAAAAAFASVATAGRSKEGPTGAAAARVGSNRSSTSDKSGTETTSLESAFLRKEEGPSAVTGPVGAPSGGRRVERDVDREQPPDQSVVPTSTAAPSAAAPGNLPEMVEELRCASLLGPDGPGVDRADVLRRLRLLGPAGAAVARSLGE